MMIRKLLMYLFVLALGMSAALAVPSTRAQDGDSYTFTIVGGVEEPQTYADQVVDGFEFTHFTYRSLYPGGLEFRVTITPPDGVTYRQVTLFYTFSTGKPGRAHAQPGDAPGEWVAVPYAARGLPPWHEIDAYWGVRGDDVSVNSEPVHAVYYDASREWYRAESEDIVVYWFGMPEELGRYVLEGMAGNRERYLEGFGQPLPYRPLAVIFPPGPVWNEYKGDSSIDDTEFGFTGTIISEAGSTIQRVRTLEPATLRKDCIWNPENPSVEFQMNQAASTTTHEVAHLYQDEIGLGGPFWWVEGQATFFEIFEEYPLHERLRTLAALRGGDFPSFQNRNLSRGTQITSEDGCTHLGYDMGASFMSWLVDQYGGMATYHTVVDEMAHAATLEEALVTATGYTLLELENEWRAFLGVEPVAAEVIDPSLTLSDPVEPYFEAGETLTLPGTPFQQPIYEAPSTQSVANAACFANNTLTILRAGSDETVNWYEVECMGMTGWMHQAQFGAP